MRYLLFIVLLSLSVVSFAKEPEWRAIKTVKGVFKRPNEFIKETSFKSAYGSANNTRIYLDIGATTKDISTGNVTICLQRKVNNTGVNFFGCSKKVNNSVIFSQLVVPQPIDEQPTPMPVKPPVTPPSVSPVKPPVTPPSVSPVKPPVTPPSVSPVTPPVTPPPVDPPVDVPEDPKPEPEEPKKAPKAVPIEEPVEDEEPIPDLSMFSDNSLPRRFSLGHLELEQEYFLFISLESFATSDLSFEIIVEVLSCDNDEVIDKNGSCIKATDISHGERKSGHSDAAAFRSKIGSKSNHIIGGQIMTLILEKASKIEFYGKFGASPTPDNYDFIFQQTGDKFQFNLTNSLPGYWYYLFQFEESQKYEVHFNVKHCPYTVNSTKYGVLCENTIPNLEGVGAINLGKADNDRLTYYRVISNPENGNAYLNVSVGSFEYSRVSFFELYISEDELPFYSNTSKLIISDLTNCSVAAKECFSVKTLISNKKTWTPTNYFVGVRFVGYDDDSKTFGIFKNSTCVQCKDGQCSYSGQSRGTCVCSEETHALDCSIYKLKWKISSLEISISSGLIGSTTIVILICYLIARRKKATFETL